MNDQNNFFCPETSEQRRERRAKALYDAAHKGLRNCWSWDDSGLDDEHPGSRDKYYRFADAVFASDRAAQLAVTAEALKESRRFLGMVPPINPTEDVIDPALTDLPARSAAMLRVVEAARRCVSDDADDDLWAEADAELRDALRAIDGEDRW